MRMRELEIERLSNTRYVEKEKDRTEHMRGV